MRTLVELLLSMHCIWYWFRVAGSLSAMVPLDWIGPALFEAPLRCYAVLLDEDCATARHIDRSVLVNIVLAASSAARVLRVGMCGDPMLVAAHLALIMRLRAMLHITYISGCAANHPKRDRQQIFVIEPLRLFPLFVRLFLIFIIALLNTYLLLLRIYYLHRVCCVNLQ